jgi:type I restriction enzyme, S subunit
MGPFGSDIKTDNFVRAGVPVIRGMNLNLGRFNEEDFVFITEEKAASLRSANTFRDDIVFTHRGTLGQVGIIPQTSKHNRYVISQSQMKLTCDKSKVEPLFIFYFFRSPLGQHALLRNTSTTGVPAISQPVTSLKSIKLSLPPIKEQRVISSLLGKFDDKIDLNNQINRTLSHISSSIFTRWFVDFEFPNEDGKPYKSSGGEMIDSELRAIPSDWKVAKIRDVARINEHTLGQNYPHDTIEYIDISSVSEGKLLGTVKLEKKKAPSRARRLVRHGDIIWSTVRPNRRAYLFIHSPAKNLVVSTGFAVITPKTVPSSYLYFWVTTEGFIDYLSSNADGSAYPAVKPERILEAQILLPSQRILDIFNSITGRMLGMVWQNTNQSLVLASIRDIVLPKLVSGEIRISSEIMPSAEK